MTRMDPTTVRQRLKRLVQADDDGLPLARTSLLIAQEEYLDLDRCAYKRKLASMARAVRSRCDRSDIGPKCLAAIGEQMFQIERFRGNAEGYYDPRNSFLSDVLDRKLGIPITLSISYLELCWRTGVSAVGVGLPGHFIVRVDVGELIYVDPFDSGAKSDLTACAEKFRQVHSQSTTFHPSMLAPVGRRQILFRVLANLKSIYLKCADYGRALAAIDRMLLLRPDSASEYRDRAVVCQEIGFISQACADFQTYLQAAPGAPDAKDIHQALATAIARRGWSN